MVIRRTLIVGSLLACWAAAVVPASAQDKDDKGKLDFSMYDPPKTADQFWRAIRFEMKLGQLERAAKLIRGLLELNPEPPALVELTEKKAVRDDEESGLVPFLRLLNVPKWSNDKNVDRDAKEDAKKLVADISKALEAVLKNPERIRKFVNNLSGEPEERAFALNELRRSRPEALVQTLSGLLLEGPPTATRAAILDLIPVLARDTVPGFVAFLEAPDANVRSDILTTLGRRLAAGELPAAYRTKLIPTLWYLAADKKNSAALRAQALTFLNTISRPGREIGDDLVARAPAELVKFARAQEVVKGTASDKEEGEGADKKVTTISTVPVWQWEGKRLDLKQLPPADARDFYALRYSRWALDLKPDFEPAQKTFLAASIDKRYTALDRPLSAVAPDLHAIMATAPASLLGDLLADEMATGEPFPRPAVALAAVQVLGERRDKSAAAATAKPVGAAGALVRAFDSTDPRVKFAAAEGLLGVPGQPAHGRVVELAKYLAGLVAAYPADGDPRPKALLTDPDRSRGESFAAFLRAAGFRVEVVRTGRDVFRRLREKSDIDLLCVDRHAVEPEFGKLVAELRADSSAKTIPLVAIASDDKPTPVSQFTALARMSAVLAFETYQDLQQVAALSERAEKGTVLSRREVAVDQARERLRGGLLDAAKRAGIANDDQLKARLDYLSAVNLRIALARTDFRNENAFVGGRALQEEIDRSGVRVEPDPTPSAAGRERSLALMQQSAVREEKLATLAEPAAQFSQEYNFAAHWALLQREIDGLFRANVQRRYAAASLAPADRQDAARAAVLAASELPRNSEAERKVRAAVRGYKGVVVVPAELIVADLATLYATFRGGDATFDDAYRAETKIEADKLKRERLDTAGNLDLAYRSVLTRVAFADAKAPVLTPSERRIMAVKAAQYLTKMARGEILGYTNAGGTFAVPDDVSTAVRHALQVKELAPLVIEAVGRLKEPAAQQDLANVVLAKDRPADVRSKAADALLMSRQAYGPLLGKAQADSLADLANEEADAGVRGKVAALIGTMRADATTTGDRLKGYVPPAAEPSPPPKEKDKVDEKKD